MQRVSGANYLPNGNGEGKNAYQDYNAGTGQPGTTPNAAAFNALQEEIGGFIEAQGIPLSANDNTQLAAAIAAYVASTLGNIAGVTSLTTSQTISTALNGWVIQTPVSGITLTMPNAAANENKTLSLFNTSSGPITAVAGNFNSASGVGVTSIIIPAGATISLTSDGTSWNAFSGALAAGAPVKPQSAAGIGQWTLVLTTTNLMYLPAGGTWSYFAANNGIGYGAAQVAGGTAIFSGTLNNAFGICWRTA